MSTIVFTNVETMHMSTINFRIDDDIKLRSYRVLKELGVTPSELLRQTLEYVAENGKLPFKQVLLNDEDVELLARVKERLDDPQPVKVTLDEL